MNYRAWNHRLLVSYVPKTKVIDELVNHRDWAGLHVADNSCFHYRTALPFEKITSKFHVVTSHIEETLSQIHYESFELSEEVHEQKDLARVSCGKLDTETATTLSEKLCLTTINDLKRESLAIHDLAYQLVDILLTVLQ
nr:protein prenyltransferase alpha subunit repeat-containing protein 1 [Tanacetum cinerariifolium]